jgi:hypothetical protein
MFSLWRQHYLACTWEITWCLVRMKFFLMIDRGVCKWLWPHITSLYPLHDFFHWLLHIEKIELNCVGLKFHPPASLYFSCPFGVGVSLIHMCYVLSQAVPQTYQNLPWEGTWNSFILRSLGLISLVSFCILQKLKKQSRRWQRLFINGSGGVGTLKRENS